MKKLSLILLTMIWSFSVYSSYAENFENNLEAPGKVFYKMKDENLVYRNVTLKVNEGKISLKGEAREVVAHAYIIKEKFGRPVLFVVFLNPHGAAENTALILKGSLIKGKNKGTYYGDMFYKKYRPHSENTANFISQIVEDDENNGGCERDRDNCKKKLEYKGGFYFVGQGPHFF